ncbi:MAG: HTTM domain-containing protein [Mariniblastus sp.]
MIKYLEEEVDGSSVAFIRIAFAATMVFWLTMHLVLDKIAFNYYEPQYLFPYFGFDWIQPWPGRGLHLHFVVTLVAALGMLFGVFYRFSSVVFAVGFIYIAMLDKATYQNHYYLICLLAILFAVCPSDRTMSFDSFRLKRPTTVPRWVVWLFRFQIGLVYFFGGVAKINSDWLAGFPMQQVLAGKQDHFLIGSFCQEQWFVYAFVWGGMLFDLLIVGFLLFPKTRVFGFVLTLAFHLTNASLFRIGVFPWVMIFLTMIFFSPDWPRQVFSSLFKSESDYDQQIATTAKKNLFTGYLLRCFAVAFVLLQLWLPLRHFAYSEVTNWTERNHHFSWHMKLRGKTTAIRIYAIDDKTGEFAIVDLRNYFKLHQLKRMGRDPFMIRDFARFVGRDFERRGVSGIAVRVFALCSLNGRKPQLLIDPTVDLTQEELPDDWIVPLESEIGGNWNEPLDRWEQLVMRDPILALYGKSRKTEDQKKMPETASAIPGTK